MTAVARVRYRDRERISGHADRNGLESFVETMHPRPGEILCVHGDESATDQLSSSLYQRFDVRTYAPRNPESYRLA